LIFLLALLKSRGVIPYDGESQELFPFVLVYFVVTVLIWVIGVRSIAPKQLKTRFPGVYFPTNREGVAFLMSVWGRMLIWFLGAASAGMLLTAMGSHLK